MWCNFAKFKIRVPLKVVQLRGLSKLVTSTTNFCKLDGHVTSKSHSMTKVGPKTGELVNSNNSRFISKGYNSNNCKILREKRGY